MPKLTPNPSFSLTFRVQLLNRAGMLSSVISALAEAGGNLGQIDLIQQTRKISVRDITVNAYSTEHMDKLIAVVKAVPEIRVLDVYDRTFQVHQGGKIHLEAKVAVKGQDDLAMVYTPGVGRVCMAIAEDKRKVYDYTIKCNTIAVVTDGTAVLGLGDIGPEAAMPVMEGKAMLFKQFAGLDAFPICLNTKDVDEIVETVKRIAPTFGGVNLEDISAPRCFEIEKRLKEELDIPVYHDDQHGTAIVVVAATINALKVVGKPIDTVRIVMNGAGASGIAVARLLREAGVKQISMCDSKGCLNKERTDLTAEKLEFVSDFSGSLADVIKGADMFIGLSVKGALTPEMVRSMAPAPIVFAMANPNPEIQPELVVNDVAVIATGRSDYANQINNVLAFPGIFRGALDARVHQITTQMNLGAAQAIASLVSASDLAPDFIIPSVFDPRVSHAVAAAVQAVARQQGLAND
ncbi:NAD-dependent malic enzyme [Pseudanabaena yagii]|uniref:NAD-dependent malic enzyme n=1 Tax=Pseudanabaena yagii GIHE-NHR1 TaxID=2722753 RepID=A0ABX1LPU6_9CYAN|nr:NAD-dependent malic enzyme [Pseudanabaena yagii]NMF56859.1 NAD-dependent malic enzyme [Pseudanabaena yagii GIHE-NHR1]